MKEILLYDNLMIKVPEDFIACGEDEKSMFFNFSGADFAYVNKENVCLAIKSWIEF